MTEKSLANSDNNCTRKNVPDAVFFGNSDMWQLLSKVSSQSEGWMKSCKAMQVPHGCCVQVSSQQRNLDGSYAVAEALTFVPGVQIVDDPDFGGRKLIAPSAAASAAAGQ